MEDNLGNNALKVIDALFNNPLYKNKILKY